MRFPKAYVYHSSVLCKFRDFSFKYQERTPFCCSNNEKETRILLLSHTLNKHFTDVKR